MREATKFYDVLSRILSGKIYLWDDLKKFSRSPSRDIHHLLDRGLLRKVGPGLYLRPKKTRFGYAPPSDDQLVKAFLKTNDYLLLSESLYNSLGLGLTQLKNTVYVYNKKRYETVDLSGRLFNFKRLNNGYPKKLTTEFLLVDLVNNINTIGEDPKLVMEKIVAKVRRGDIDTAMLSKSANKYGKVGTRKFFNKILNEEY